jgi:hypothetical protein
LKIGIRTIILLFLLAAIAPAASSWAQADSGASRHLEASAFGGGTGTYTGYDGGQNASLTVGGDLGFPTYYGLLASAEIRGTYPFYKGKLNAYENFFGGVKIEKLLHQRYNVYGTILYGRAQVTYNPPGRLNPAGTVLYQQTNTSAYSGGIGCDYDYTPRIAFKAELQLQHYEVPVTANGTAIGKATTFAVVYRFGYGHVPIE